MMKIPLEEIVIGVARGEPMDVDEQARLEAALRRSERLRDVRRTQEKLSADLAGLRESLRQLGSLDREQQELKLRAAFRARRPGRSRLTRSWRLPGLAAACIAVVMIATMLVALDGTSSRGWRTTARDGRDAEIAVAPAETHAPDTVRDAAILRAARTPEGSRGARTTTEGSRDERATAEGSRAARTTEGTRDMRPTESSGSDSAAESLRAFRQPLTRSAASQRLIAFQPLMYAPRFSPGESYSVVRVRIPLSALIATHGMELDGAVEADILLGVDGLASGIRFESEDTLYVSTFGQDLGVAK